MNKIDVNAITAYCTQATTRIQIRQRDINGESKRIEKDICQKYTKGDVELANIAVENVINNKKMIAVLEYLNQYIQTIQARIGALNYERTIPTNMRIYIATILYCCGRVPIKEVDEICKLLRRRYGKELEGLTKDVDSRVSSRLTPVIPQNDEINGTLREILRKNNIEVKEAPMQNPLISFIDNPAPVPTVPAASPVPTAPSFPPASPAAPSSGMPSFPPTAPTFPPAAPSSTMPSFPPIEPSFPPASPAAPSSTMPSFPPIEPSFPPASPAAPSPTMPSFPPIEPSFPPASPAAPAAPAAPDMPTFPSASTGVPPSFPPPMPTFPTGDIPPFNPGNPSVPSASTFIHNSLPMGFSPATSMQFPPTTQNQDDDETLRRLNNL